MRDCGGSTTGVNFADVMKKGKPSNPKTALTHGILFTGGLLFLFPFLWMLSTSLKRPGDVMLYPPKLLPPTIEWNNFIEVWRIMPFALFLKNTVIVTAFSVFGELATASMVAFAFARLRFRGKKILFSILMATMMLPIHVTMIPRFIIFNSLGMVDTLYPLIIPSFLGGTAFYIFLLRQFFASIPAELDEAARIDGCSTFGIFFRIILPLSKPALATVAVFAFVGVWNDFINPLIYLNSIDNQTLAIGLQSFQGQYRTDLHWLMAGSAISLIPIIIVFVFVQRYFVQAVALTGMKD